VTARDGPRPVTSKILPSVPGRHVFFVNLRFVITLQTLSGALVRIASFPYSSETPRRLSGIVGTTSRREGTPCRIVSSCLTTLAF
jgi:hypothetical protein